MQRPFSQIDVFTAVPFSGNPVAVVLDGTGLSAEEMQRFARWTNLSETTFVCAATDPGADYLLRIFTPGAELPFAGHPTLGSAHAVLEAGIARPRTGGRLVQQCGVGLVDIAVGPGWPEGVLSFRLPPHRLVAAPDASALLSALSIGSSRRPPAIVDVGPRWAIVELASIAEVAALAPDLAALRAYDRAHGTTGLTVFAASSSGAVKVRSFAPLDGIAEDPVCGSGNGAVAAFRLEQGDIAAGEGYVASQGQEIGRDGRIEIAVRDDGIHVGGRCVSCIAGSVLL